MSLVSIIIPCFNEERLIYFLLEALLKQTYPLDKTEVIISDGMSTDQTREKIREFQKEHPELRLRIVDNPKRNIPSGLNRAIESAEGEFLVRLDAHSMPDPDLVLKSVQGLESGIADNVGGVWEIRSSRDHWVSNSITAAASHKLGVGDAKYRYTNKPEFVDTVPFGAFKKETFEKFGKYNEELLTNEDYELNARIRKGGGKIWLDPQIRSIYFARETFALLARQYWRYGYWKFRMLRDYPQTLRWRQALPPLFVLGLVFLLLISLILAPARLLFFAILILYFLILAAGSMPVIFERKDIRYLFGLPFAIFIMHICWGSGFLWSMVKSKAWSKKEEN